MKIDWQRHIHSGWRRVLGAALIVFGLLSSAYYYLDMRVIAQHISQSPQNVVTPSSLARSAPARVSPTAASSLATSPLVATKGLVKLSTATQAELESLPSIGAVKAKAILEYRQTRGFKTISDLQNVKGIGPKTLEKLKPLVEL